jgi:peptide-methionine (S)-S-oxide reductase
MFQEQLSKRDGAITTEILPAPEFYYAEDHQQYLSKNPDKYCGLGGMSPVLSGSRLTVGRCWSS